MKNNYEIIKYENDSISIDIRCDSINNTIWLTQSEMASILSLTVNAVSKNIKKIEKEASVIAWEANTEIIGTDGKTYKAKLYNLDMIEEISKRSKSNNAYEFIKWANKLIEEKKSDLYQATA